MKHFTLSRGLQIIIVASFLTLVSCGQMKIQTSNASSFIDFAASPWIEINNELVIQPLHTRAYLQYGELIHPDVLNLYETNCEIEVKQVLEVNQIINPGRYEIAHIIIDESSVVFLPHQAIQYAMGGGGTGSYDTKAFWQFTLQSDENPDVLFMLCRGVQEDVAEAELPTIEEIKQAVGDNITIHLIQPLK